MTRPLRRNGFTNGTAEAAHSLPKDREWIGDDYGALEFFLRKRYTIKRIAHELRRTPEDVRARKALLPLYMPGLRRDLAGHLDELMCAGVAVIGGAIRATYLA